MSKTLDRSKREAHYIFREGPAIGQRTGEFLFNTLRHEIAEACRGTVFDPFEKDMTEEEIVQWLEDHIVYNNEGKMICFFIGNTILWEEKKSA